MVPSNSFENYFGHVQKKKKINMATRKRKPLEENEELSCRLLILQGVRTIVSPICLRLRVLTVINDYIVRKHGNRVCIYLDQKIDLRKGDNVNAIVFPLVSHLV